MPAPRDIAHTAGTRPSGSLSSPTDLPTDRTIILSSHLMDDLALERQRDLRAHADRARATTRPAHRVRSVLPVAALLAAATGAGTSRTAADKTRP